MHQPTGCESSKSGGKGDKAKKQDTIDDEFIPTDKAYKIDEVMNDARVSCAKPEHCPEAVGYVLSSKKNSSGRYGIHQCTGTLVSSDIVLTNSHCIPDAVKEQADLCRDRLGIMFPSPNGETQTVHAPCVELVSFSKLEPDNKMKEDYAFFRIDLKEPRSHFRISRDGGKNNQIVKLFTVNPTSRYSAVGNLVAKSCVLKQKSMAYGKASHDFYPVLIGFENTNGPEDCSVIQGNSGSAALDSNGRIISVVHGIMENAANELGDTISGLNAAPGFRVSTDHLLDFAVFTNLACIKTPNELSLGSIHEDCSLNDDESFFDWDSIKEHLKTALTDSLDPRSLTLERSLGPEVKVLRYSPVMIVQEETNFLVWVAGEYCFIPDQWNNGFRMFAWDKTYELAVFDFFMTLNPHWQVEGRIEKIPTERSASVQLNIPRQARLTLEDKDVGTFQIESNDQDFPLHGLSSSFSSRLCYSDEASAEVPTSFDFERLDEQL